MPRTQREAAHTDDDAPDPRRVLAARRIRLLESDLYLVIGPVEGRDLEETVREAIAGGVDIVQLRAKNADDAWLIETGANLARICHAERVLFFINDRPDLVHPIGADGVHVGQDDLSVAEAREIAGPSALIGVSTHTPAELAQAAEDGADYAGVGPVHATPTKPGRPATGYRYVHHASLHAELPWFAIGGIDESTVDRTLASGAERLVVVRAIAESDDPRAAAEALKQAIADRPRRASAEERNAAVRAELRPFAPGERPAAAALAAFVLAAVGLVNLLMLLIGYEPRQALRGTNATVAELIFGVAIVGLSVAVWKLRAWALLITEAILGITALTSFGGLVVSNSIKSAVATAAAMLVAGWLFYKLIRVLARAQTPKHLPAAGGDPDQAADHTTADEPELVSEEPPLGDAPTADAGSSDPLPADASPDPHTPTAPK